MTYKSIIILISIVIAGMDVTIAAKALSERKKEGHYLAGACFLAALVDISYLLSLFCENPVIYSCLTSTYFISIDIMLMFLVRFVEGFTKMPENRIHGALRKAAVIYAIIDIVLLASNPLTGICIDYIPRDTDISFYAYDMKLPYYCHLIFAYSIVAFIFVLLIYKSCKVAKEYRRLYLVNLLVILLVLAVNAVFLYMDSYLIISLLDASIWGYSIAGMTFYWSCFSYSRKGMLTFFKGSIFDNIEQGLILFDYNGALILRNEKAKQMLPNIEMDEGVLLEDFLEQCGIGKFTGDDENTESNSLQIYHQIESKEVPFRCDYRRIDNSKKRLLGRLFVFSDMTMESDWLTGFQNWDSLCSSIRLKKYVHAYPLTVAACDITALAIYNASKGRAAGDQLIKQLATLLRQNFSSGAYFVRGDDAMMIVMDYSGNEKAAIKAMKQVEEAFEGRIEYAVCSATEDSTDILDTINQAKETISAKKLLNQESRHSTVLTSLMQALKESDETTESHVRRTQLLGSRLGERLGLSDLEQSQLKLLCMLHDIGKIGIPLEILNKPGKLTDEEWAVIKTHPDKGYQIAMSAPELNGIAAMIRHHHECWDGSGYPDGISRESIPLLSRIISVIDTYDAMVNDRPYRKGLSIDCALAELKRHAGTQFDPTIVSEFLQIMSKEDMEGIRVITEITENEDNRQRQSRGVIRFNSQEDTETVFTVDYARYYLDEKMYIIDCDKRFEEITGYTLKDLQKKGMRQEDLLPENCRTEYLGIVNAQLAKSDICFLEHRLVTKSGKEVNVFCMGRRYFDYAANTLRSELIITKSSDTHLARVIAMQEQKKALIRLEQWENTYRCDSLTGLLQHSPFKNDVEKRLLDGNCKVMMLMIDLDNFKQYNDTLGHQAGDNLLVMLGKSLEESLRQTDLACRMGGDEFAGALFFEPEQPEELLMGRAHEIFEKLQVMLHALELPTSVSIGVAISDENSTFSSLYQKADQALYAAKNNGRDRIEF